MPFSQGYYDPETLALMTGALDAACLEMKHAMASEGLGYAAVAHDQEITLETLAAQMQKVCVARRQDRYS